MVTNRFARHNYVPKLEKPSITAQPREHIEITADISIQALAIYPELLPRSPRPGKKSKKHEDHCECERCEHAAYTADLDFT